MVQDAVLPSASIKPGTTDAAREGVSSFAESWIAAVAMGAAITLKIVYAFVFRIDSDEPQHMHVVWGWAHGLLQYRDLFDNHSPLFQALCSPLLRLLGEHAWIMIPMRLAMLPLFFADAWLIFAIARALYPQRWAFWIAAVAGCWPVFFLTTTEFRTDDLWTALWLLAVWLAVAAPLRGRRAFCFGLTIGACFAVSMKTTLLLLSLATAYACILALRAMSRRGLGVREGLKSGGLILAGMLIVPAVVIGYFAAHGALREMYYCVIQHNVAPGLGKSHKMGFHNWLYPLSLPALLGLGWLCMHSSPRESVGAGRALVLITGGACYYLLKSYWPLVTAQDFTPITPLATLSAMPLVFHLLRLKWPERIVLPAAALAVMGVEIGIIWATQSPLKNEARIFQQDLASVLQLTTPGDLVMDGKGETIYRNRPVYWVLEGVTLHRMKLGLIKNDVRQKIIDSHTCVVLNHRISDEDKEWVKANYIEGDNKVWIAGRHLGDAKPETTFQIAIQAPYTFVSDKGKLAGAIDGRPLAETQELTPGEHKLAIAAGSGQVAVVWTPALKRGYNPFTGKIAGVND